MSAWWALLSCDESGQAKGIGTSLETRQRRPSEGRDAGTSRPLVKFNPGDHSQIYRGARKKAVKKTQEGEWTIYENDSGDLRVGVRSDTTKPYFTGLHGNRELENQIDTALKDLARMKAQAKKDEEYLLAKAKSPR
jgi:hypothetical protein